MVERIKQVLNLEAEAIANLASAIDEDFERAVKMILSTRGRVIVTGMGKSGIICKKIAATFASTGTPALFLHPADALHGDLGMIMRDDTMLAISNSGESVEILGLIPFIKRFGIGLISITGRKHSSLAENSDIALHIGDVKEACPFGCVPTTSTTVTLALGDAIAIALLECRELKLEDFAKLHPGGAIGRKLLTVGNLMHSGDLMPVVTESTLLRAAILEMSSKRLGMVCVTDRQNRVVGIITDGDLRRIIEKDVSLLNMEVKCTMTKNPKVVKESILASEAVQIMEKYSITSLIVLDGEKYPVGVVHLHDCLKAGVV